MQIVVIASALLPAILLWLYIWKKDAQPEPVSWLIKAVLGGALVIIPVIFVEQVVSTMLFGAGGEPTNLFETTAQAFLVAALPEETFKLLVLWLLLRKNPYFDEHFDGIVYAVCVGLGFAAVENVFYIINEEAWVTIAISRALLAVPGHYAFAVLMGYYYSLYHFLDDSPKVAVCILLVPVLAHGVYDALVMSGTVNPYVGGICFFVLIFFCVKMHKEAKAKVLAMIENDARYKHIV